MVLAIVKSGAVFLRLWVDLNVGGFVGPKFADAVEFGESFVD